MIRIVCIGKMKDRRLAGLVDEYARRIRPWANLEIVELKDSDPRREGAALLTQLDRIGAGHGVALDERGDAADSHAMAELLASRGSLSFLIGGPDGLDDAVRKRADRLMSLSSMTFTHEMARFILAEQIYRGLAINRNHRYHRD